MEPQEPGPGKRLPSDHEDGKQGGRAEGDASRRHLERRVRHPTDLDEEEAQAPHEREETEAHPPVETVAGGAGVWRGTGIASADGSFGRGFSSGLGAASAEASGGGCWAGQGKEAASSSALGRGESMAKTLRSPRVNDKQ